LSFADGPLAVRSGGFASPPAVESVRRGSRFGGRRQTVFEQLGHVALDFVELIEPQVRIGNGETSPVAGCS